MMPVDQIKERYTSLDAATRRLIIISLGLALLFLVGYSTLISHISNLNRNKTSREQTLKELLVLRQRHQEAVATTQRLTNRMASVTPDDSPASVIEQTGIVPKGALQSKPLPQQEQGTLLEEGAEISLTGLSLNEVVNLLYRLEQGAKPVVVRKATIRSRFSEPAKLDCTLQVALLKNPSQGKP